jgi:hypothetical protein
LAVGLLNMLSCHFSMACSLTLAVRLPLGTFVGNTLYAVIWDSAAKRSYLRATKITMFKLTGRSRFCPMLWAHVCKYQASVLGRLRLASTVCPPAWPSPDLQQPCSWNDSIIWQCLTKVRVPGPSSRLFLTPGLPKNPSQLTGLRRGGVVSRQRKYCSYSV